MIVYQHLRLTPSGYMKKHIKEKRRANQKIKISLTIRYKLSDLKIVRQYKF